MPRGDRTGPVGMGPMTGRAAGYCAGLGVPGYSNPAPGRMFRAGVGMGGGGLGRGFGGGGRGWRHWFHATGLPGWMRFGGWAAPYAKPDRESERRTLRNEAQALKATLDSIQSRLSELEAGPDKP
ncbi:MAG: DUF5320 domain-containing protein [Acidobacteriota bacterium]